MDENVEVKKTVIQKRVFQTCGTFPGIVLAAGEAVLTTTKPSVIVKERSQTASETITRYKVLR